MEWFLANHHAQSCFSSLGTQIGDNYVLSENCLDILNEIQWKLATEDKISRPVRRAINFSQVLQKDFIPLLVGTKDTQVIRGIVKILVDLLVPVDCLVPEDVASNTDVGRITVYELNVFLVRSKSMFRDPRIARAVLDFIKLTAKLEGEVKLDDSECDDINNCLVLLRNILHIPEARHVHCTIQNQIVWNLFVNNIDRVLINLMTCEQRSRWGVAIVQLVAVLYKDQNAGVLQKLLNVGFEGSLSDSSGDNESNTMQDQQSDSTPVVTSEPTSDSSDSGKNEGSSGVRYVALGTALPGLTAESASPTVKMLIFEEATTTEPLKGTECRASGRSGKRGVDPETPETPAEEDNSRPGGGADDTEASTNTSGNSSTSNTTPHPGMTVDSSRKTKTPNNGHRWQTVARGKPPSEAGSQKRESSLEYSDCGYVSHVETPEVVDNFSSSDDEENHLRKRKAHVKPHNQKTRYTTKQQSAQEKKDARRKKLMKRSKSTLMKMKALANHVPTDGDITYVLKEFTIDFMLKGFDPLVTVLYQELMVSSTGVLMDTSHFFWLITYFIKFAGQLELDLDHIRESLSYRVVSYLVYESVRIAEHVDASLRKNCPELRIILRRQHLAVTAIREFIQSVDAYDKSGYITFEDMNFLQGLQGEISISNDMKCLFVLLLRQYNSEIHTKQYLEDLVVTNHIFISFLERVGGIGNNVPHRLSITDLIKQFASADVIKQYGLLLEGFQSNGGYINDCILTMMHHIAGEMNQVASLCQPNILKTFTQIWESEFELCDDWSDLIEYVIHRFVSIPRHCPMVGGPSPVLPVVGNTSADDSCWRKEECGNLYWYFNLSSPNSDPIANIIRLYEENGVIKTRIAVIERLMKQGVIKEEVYKELLDAETMHSNITIMETDGNPGISLTKLTDDETDNLRERLIETGMGTQLLWLQRIVLETCYVKFILENHPSVQGNASLQPSEPIPYYFSLFQQAVPIVPWNADLSEALHKKTFQSLLRNLGFQMPSDENTVFVRIPSFWSHDTLLKVAEKLGPLDTTQLKFDIQRVRGFGGEPPMSAFAGMDVSSDDKHFVAPRAKHYSSLIKHTPPINDSTGNWMEVVKNSKVKPPTPENMGEGGEKMEMENVECASVPCVDDMELGCMYVSDEEFHL